VLPVAFLLIFLGLRVDSAVRESRERVLLWVPCGGAICPGEGGTVDFEKFVEQRSIFISEKACQKARKI
jgi:hypothetical protein